MPEVAERSTVGVLRAARERISDPSRWCAGASARTSTGAVCDYWDPAACKWCALGAVEREGEHPGAYTLAYNLLREVSGRESPITVNDRGGHAAALAMLDDGIQLAEQEATNG